MNLTAIRAALKAKLAARQADTEALATLRIAAEQPNTTVTPAELTAAIAQRDAHDPQIDALLDQERAAVAEETRDAAMSELMNRTVPGTGAPEQVRRPGTTAPLDGVQREPRTYTSANNTSGDERISFFQDAYRSQFLGDRASASRIDRHAAEVRVEGDNGYQERATTTTSYAGLVVPQYLTDMVAPVLRFGRPLANACNRHPLPSRGMSLIIPRGTTGASTAIQSSQNTAVSLTDEVNADLTVPVVTIAGQQDVARQALERGEFIDQFVYGDLSRAHAANVDNQVINGSGAAGQMLGIVNTGGINAATAYGAPITAALFQLKVAGQWTAVTSAGVGLFAKMIIVHPRRWGWLTAQVDSTGRPIVTANTVPQFNAAAQITSPGQVSADNEALFNGYHFVGTHSSGLPVLSDLNVPTTAGTINEDLVFVSDTQEYHLWEEGTGAPTELKFDQTTGGSLTTKLVVYSYAAFTAGRYPGATGKIGGLDTTVNGQIAPAF